MAGRMVALPYPAFDVVPLAADVSAGGFFVGVGGQGRLCLGGMAMGMLGDGGGFVWWAKVVLFGGWRLVELVVSR